MNNFNENSLIMKVTILSLLEKMGAVGIKNAVTVTVFRDEYKLVAHTRLNGQISDMVKPDLLGRIEKSEKSEKGGKIKKIIKWYMKPNGTNLLKKNQEKIVDLKTLYEIFGEKKSQAAQPKQPELNLSIHANSSIEGIVKLSEENEKLKRYLLTIQTMTTNILNEVLPEKVEQQDTSM